MPPIRSGACRENTDAVRANWPFADPRPTTAAVRPGVRIEDDPTDDWRIVREKPLLPPAP